MEQLVYDKDDPYVIVLLDDDCMLGFWVGVGLRDVFGHNPTLAAAIIREVEKLGKAPCYCGTLAECTRLKKKLDTFHISSTIAPV